MTHLVASWSDRDVVTVTGPDAGTFLQGQVSQDVLALAVGGSSWSLLLDPSGKLVAWLRIRRVDDETYELDVDAGWAEAVMARLQRFKLRVKCDLAELPERRMLSVRAAAGETLPDDVPADALPPAGAAVGVVGYDLVGVDPTPPDGLTIDDDAVEELRVAAGIPAMGRELDDSTIPAEIGRWFVDDSVSWTKGCYTGQELVARLDSRGSNTPRRLRSIELTGPAAPGDAVTVEGAAVGTLTSVFGDRALALIARAVAPPAAATVGGNPATIVSIPGSEPAPAVVADGLKSSRRSLI